MTGNSRKRTQKSIREIVSRVEAVILHTPFNLHDRVFDIFSLPSPEEIQQVPVILDVKGKWLLLLMDIFCGDDYRLELLLYQLRKKRYRKVVAAINTYKALSVHDSDLLYDYISTLGMHCFHPTEYQIVYKAILEGVFPNDSDEMVLQSLRRLKGQHIELQALAGS